MSDYKMIEGVRLKTLRDRGLVGKEEVVFTTGDLVVAENVITKNRRVLGGTEILIETNVNKRLLKG